MTAAPRWILLATMKRTALAIAAHPDDIEFWMAGTLLLLQEAGWEIHCFNVANGSLGSLVMNTETTRKVRRVEAQTAARVRAVVAIGEAAAEVEAAFAGIRPVVVATSMNDAVERAAGLAQRGDTVLLSPGTASFDWYRSYGERGDDFARAVREFLAEEPS